MVYTHTDIGHKRSENQDSTGVAVLDGAVFAVVCDGMGGSNAGSEASSRAVSVITERIQKSYRSDYDDNKIRNLLVAAVKTANAVIYDLASAVPEWRGMGTTCVAAFVSDTYIAVANVGDSRLYLLRDSLAQISILAAVQDEFHVKFNIDEIVALKNVGDLVNAIERKL